MSHADVRRCRWLLGEEVIPVVRGTAKKLDLYGAFEVDPATNQPVTTPSA